jgi:hypothetical protein
VTKKSRILYTNAYLGLQKKIVAFLNKQPDFLSSRTVNSPRAVGDAIDYFKRVRKFWEKKEE